MLSYWLWMGGSVLTLALLMLGLLPRGRARDIWTVMLTMQSVKWLLGAIKVELHLESFTVHVFPHSTRQDFMTEFAVCPAIAVLYVLVVTARPRLLRLLHLVWISAAFAIWNLLMTDWLHLQQFIHWSAWLDFATLLVLLPAVRRIAAWIRPGMSERGDAGHVYRPTD